MSALVALCQQTVQACSSDKHVSEQFPKYTLSFSSKTASDLVAYISAMGTIWNCWLCSSLDVSSDILNLGLQQLKPEKGFLCLILEHMTSAVPIAAQNPPGTGIWSLWHAVAHFLYSVLQATGPSDHNKVTDISMEPGWITVHTRLHLRALQRLCKLKWVRQDSHPLAQTMLQIHLLCLLRLLTNDEGQNLPLQNLIGTISATNSAIDNYLSSPDPRMQRHDLRAVFHRLGVFDFILLQLDCQSCARHSTSRTSSSSRRVSTQSNSSEIPTLGNSGHAIDSRRIIAHVVSSRCEETTQNAPVPRSIFFDEAEAASAVVQSHQQAFDLPKTSQHPLRTVQRLRDHRESDGAQETASSVNKKSEIALKSARAKVPLIPVRSRLDNDKDESESESTQTIYMDVVLYDDLKCNKVLEWDAD